MVWEDYVKQPKTEDIEKEDDKYNTKSLVQSEYYKPPFEGHNHDLDKFLSPSLGET